jgi:PAS domain S-box-containing protein
MLEQVIQNEATRPNYNSVRRIKDNVLGHGSYQFNEEFSFIDVVENLNAAVLVTGLDGTIVYSNIQAPLLLGDNNDNMIGSNINDILPSLNDFIEASPRNPIQRVQKIEKIDGQNIWVSYTATPIPYLKMIVHEFSDVTWNMVSEEELLRYMRNLEQIEDNLRNEIGKYILSHAEYGNFVKQTVIDMEIASKKSETYSRYVMKDYPGGYGKKSRYLLPFLESIKELKLLVKGLKEKEMKI